MNKIISTSDDEIRDNLTAWLKKASRANIREGKAWYKDAQKFAKQLAKEYGIEKYTAAGVISALSPNNKWERNKFDANAMVHAYVNGLGIDTFNVCTYGANKRKAWRILGGGVQLTAKSPKTHAFSMNVGRLSSKHVTIDKWHCRACLLSPSDGVKQCQETLTPIQYRRLEAITAEIAEKRKMKAYQVQAIIWVTIKEAWDR